MATSEDLPSNPKAWNHHELAKYLSTVLRVKSAPVANDIARFVKEKRMTGRVFLRLTEEDLEEYGLNKLWRAALLTASRNLRQNVLKGRIWGFDSESNSGSGEDENADANENETTPNGKPKPRSSISKKNTPNGSLSRKSRILPNPPVYSSAESSSSAEDLGLSSLSTPDVDGNTRRLSVVLPGNGDRGLSVLLPESISNGSNKFKSISKGSLRMNKNSRLLQTSGFFDPLTPLSGTGESGSPNASANGGQGTRSRNGSVSPGGRYKNGRVKGMAYGFEEEALSDSNPSPNLVKEKEMSPVATGSSGAKEKPARNMTHSRMLSAESQEKISKDMALLREKGNVRSSRHRTGSVSSNSEAESPVMERGSFFFPGKVARSESPTKSHFRHEDGPSSSRSSSIASSERRPLPVPPGPPGMGAFTGNSPLPTPPPSIAPLPAELPEATLRSIIIPSPPSSSTQEVPEGEMTVEQLLIIEDGTTSLAKRKKKGKGRGKGVHAWEYEDDEARERDGEDGREGFVTVKRVAPSSSAFSTSPSTTGNNNNLSPIISDLNRLSPQMEEAKRVITPILLSSLTISPSRSTPATPPMATRVTPIPIAHAVPIKVTSEVSHDTILVHPKPMNVALSSEGEVVRRDDSAEGEGVRSETVERMEALALADDNQGKREREEVVRPLPMPPAAVEKVVAPVPGIPTPSEAVQVKRASSIPLVPLLAQIPSPPVPASNTDSTQFKFESEKEREDRELRDLIADMRKTKAMVDALKVRVEDVEKSVEGLRMDVERQEVEFRAASGSSTSSNVNKTEGKEATKALTQEVGKEGKEVALSATEKAKRAVLSLFGLGVGGDSSSSSSTNEQKKDQAKRFANPQRLAELPPYMVLVGLGVCIVVARVLWRRKR